MSEICKPCPHFPGYYYGFQYSNVTCPLCLSESRIAALEAHAKAFEARCLALSQERAALEARNAEQFRLMGQYMENAEAAHERADALEARCRELEAKVHRACNTFENITVVDSFKEAIDMAHHGVSFTMETPAEPQEVIMKCPFCGVHYVKGAAHWSECPYSDANRTVKP